MIQSDLPDRFDAIFIHYDSVGKNWWCRLQKYRKYWCRKGASIEEAVEAASTAADRGEVAEPMPLTAALPAPSEGKTFEDLGL